VINDPPFGDELAEVNYFGHPWHGLVTNGTLDTRTNGVHKAYQQPPGGGAWKVVSPNPPAQITATANETALGMQWYNYGMLCGWSSTQLYGTNLGRSWIYFDGNGDRWLITLQTYSNVDIKNPGNLSFAISLFGQFGAASQTASRSVAIADWGQSAPVIDRGDQGHTDVTRAYLFFSDIRPDGSKCALAIFDYQTGSAYPPLGFIEVTITGAGVGGIAISGSVAKTRTDVIGTSACTQTSELVQTFDTGSYGCINGGVVCSQNGQVITNIGSASISNRLIGAWYDTGGTLQYVKWEATYSKNEALTQTQTNSGGFYGDGSGIFYSGGTYTITINFSNSLSYSATATLTGLGRTLSYSWNKAPSLTQSPSVTSVDHSAGEVLESCQGLPTSCPTYDSGPVPVGAGPANPFQLWTLLWQPFSGNPSPTPIPAIYAPTCIGIYAPDPADSYSYGQTPANDLKYGAMSPLAVVTSSVRDTNNTKIYGAAHPVTGEIVFAQTNPVCFV
jgi:hypothetical protein